MALTSLAPTCGVERHASACSSRPTTWTREKSIRASYNYVQIGWKHSGMRTRNAIPDTLPLALRRPEGWAKTSKPLPASQMRYFLIISIGSLATSRTTWAMP